MRRLVLLLFASLLPAQDAARPADDHDKFGFPITFDAEVITLNDLVRSANVDSLDQLGNIRNERDKLLMEKLTEKVGELYGLKVADRDVGDFIEGQIARFDSEAEFYEDLLQQGLTLELYRDQVKRRVLAQRLNQLIRGGFLPQGRRLLPWDPNPTPREVKVAFSNDPSRRAAGSQVRWRELLVTLTQKERDKIQMQRLLGEDVSDEEIAKQERAILEPRVATVRTALAAGKSLADIAAELGVQVVEKEGAITKDAATGPLAAFLRTAKKGDLSALLDLGQARFAVAEVSAINRADEATLTDQRIVQHYYRSIAQLKQAKAEYTLRLRALEKSTVRPKRVRKQLRELLLANLKQAHRGLHAYGIH